MKKKAFLFFFVIGPLMLSLNAQWNYNGNDIYFLDEPNDGKVGIGTSSPENNLDIRNIWGPSKNALAAFRVDGYNSQMFITKTTVNHVAQIRWETYDAGIQWYTGLMEADATGTDGKGFFIGPNSGGINPTLFINSNNSIGIGNSNPLSDLHITNYKDNSTQTTASIRLQFFDTYQNVKRHRHWVIRSETDMDGGHRLNFMSGIGLSVDESPTLTTQAYLTNDGRFYAREFIDLNGPAYFISPSNTNISLKVAGNIQVHGKIEAAEIEICENVPCSDDVFEKDYDLKSLEEIESYINEHKHLPEFPSAKEFKANGYNVGEMDNILLKKIEELTLYIVEQNKRINELEEMMNH